MSEVFYLALSVVHRRELCLKNPKIKLAALCSKKSIVTCSKTSHPEGLSRINNVHVYIDSCTFFVQNIKQINKDIHTHRHTTQTHTHTQT